MVDYIASGGLSAGSPARLHALVVDAGLGGSAVRVHGALRSTTAVGIAEVARETSADTVSLAIRVGSAWRWVARICYHRHDGF